MRRGKGFSYADERGGKLGDADLARIRELAIPPAWRDVWICPDPNGHLQAVGTDDAGRRQYLYHERWRMHRDRQKFERMLEFARALPTLRRTVARNIKATELTKKRVLACAALLLDQGFFRIGSETYAEDNDSYGLATLRRAHVRIEKGTAIFDYKAKGGQRRVQLIQDPDALEALKALRRRRGGGEALLAYRNGRRWADLTSDEINDSLKQVMGEDFSAKDFRTWNATVLAAVLLAAGASANGSASKTARERAVRAAVEGVAFFLGNTPAVCRSSYIDPRVFDRFRSGWTVGGALPSDPEAPFIANKRLRTRIEKGVIDLLEERRSSPALERV